MATRGNENGNGASKRQFWITTAIAAFFVVLPLIGYITQLASISNTVSTNTGRLKDHDSSIYNLQIQVNTLQTQLSSARQALKEIETQFCAEDDMRNTLHSSDLRFEAQIYEKLFGERFPLDGTYYAHIGRCQQQGNEDGK